MNCGYVIQLGDMEHDHTNANATVATTIVTARDTMPSWNFTEKKVKEVEELIKVFKRVETVKKRSEQYFSQLRKMLVAARVETRLYGRDMIIKWAIEVPNVDDYIYTYEDKFPVKDESPQTEKSTLADLQA
jgi:hypothetical protein